MRNCILGNLLLALCFAMGVEEANSAPESKTLKGLPGIYLEVQPIDSAAQKNGLTEMAIKSAVEHNLHSIGVPILTRDQRAKSRSAPTLHVRVNTLKSSSDPLFAVTIAITLYQTVALIHTAKLEQVDAATWNLLSTGLYTETHLKDLIPEGINPLIREFGKDYVKANTNEDEQKRKRFNKTPEKNSKIGSNSLLDNLMEMPEP